MPGPTAKKAADKTAVQSGEIDIQLTKAIEINGAKVTALRMREPTVRDQRAATKASGGSAELAELTMIANLTMLTVDDLDALTLRDFSKVQAALLGFID